MTGLTPHAYLVQRRLQKARKMIAETKVLLRRYLEAEQVFIS